MGRKYKFRFFATVSDRGQIFIPKKVQEYFDIRKRDKVVFVFEEDGKIHITRKKGEPNAKETV